MKAFIKTFKPKQNAQEFIDNIFKCCLFLDLTNIWPYQLVICRDCNTVATYEKL